MLTRKIVKLALVPAFIVATNLHAQTITLQLQPASTTDLNYRIGGTAGFSVSFVPDQYRVYATTSLPRARWKDATNFRDYFGESLQVGSPVYYEADSCYVGKDPRLWNRRCIDAIGVFTKRVACNTNPSYACSGNTYWNAYPGRTNMSTFPVRPPLDDSGFGWPSNNAWGVKNFTPIIDKATLHAAQPSPPKTVVGTPLCHPTNASELATGAANSKVTQVNFPDGTSRWFMAYNSQIHKEWGGDPPGFNGEDVWRVQWAYSADGYQWTAENRPLFLDSSEAKGWCSTGLLVTDMFVENGYFYIVANRITNENIYLFRSPVDRFSTPGYDVSRGWEVRGKLDPVTGLHQWVQVPLGSQSNFDTNGAKTIIPTRLNPFGGVIRQTAIARVFASSQPNSASRYLALTVDQAAGQAAVVQLWAADDLNRPFSYQSDVANVPGGGYGYEFSFTHHPDNVPATPRLYDNDLELWFVHAVACEGILNCCEGSSCGAGTQPPPGYRAQSYFTVSRRRARLIGGIYGGT